MTMNVVKLKTARELRRTKRVRAKVVGTAERPRLVVERSLKHLRAQLIDDATGRTLCSMTDKELGVGKRTPTETAHELGKALAAKAKAKNITKAVYDRRGHRYHGRVKAFADGARAGGLTI